MHSASEELFQGHSGQAWLGSTPRPDAETNAHEMHGWGVLPGRMHSESEELFQGHSGQAWLGSTPRPDAETNSHEMQGWGVLPGPLVLLGWLPPLAMLQTRWLVTRWPS